MKIKYLFERFSLCFLLTIFSSAGHAEIWKCSDENGTIVYTDANCQNGMLVIQKFSSEEDKDKKNTTLQTVSDAAIPPEDSVAVSSAAANNDNVVKQPVYPHDSPDILTIKKARMTSALIESEKMNNLASAQKMNQNKIDKQPSKLLSAMRWAFFVKNDKLKQ